jgi:hypothetical protein
MATVVGLRRMAPLHHALNPPRWEIPVPEEEAAALKRPADRSRPVSRSGRRAT